MVIYHINYMYKIDVLPCTQEVCSKHAMALRQISRYNTASDI